MSCFLLGVFPCFSLPILSLPLLGLGSKSISFSPRPRQYNTICWKLDLIGWMESRHMVGALQEVGNTDSGVRTKCQV